MILLSLEKWKDKKYVKLPISAAPMTLLPVLAIKYKPRNLGLLMVWFIFFLRSWRYAVMICLLETLPSSCAVESVYCILAFYPTFLAGCLGYSFLPVWFSDLTCIWLIWGILLPRISVVQAGLWRDLLSPHGSYLDAKRLICRGNFNSGCIYTSDCLKLPWAPCQASALASTSAPKGFGQFLGDIQYLGMSVPAATARV